MFRVGPGPSTQVPRALHHNERLEAISRQKSMFHDGSAAEGLPHRGELHHGMGHASAMRCHGRAVAWLRCRLARVGTDPVPTAPWFGQLVGTDPVPTAPLFGQRVGTDSVPTAPPSRHAILRHASALRCHGRAVAMPGHATPGQCAAMAGPWPGSVSAFARGGRFSAYRVLNQVSVGSFLGWSGSSQCQNRPSGPASGILEPASPGWFPSMSFLGKFSLGHCHAASPSKDVRGMP